MTTTYKVTGTRPFDGHAPGETFNDDIDTARERRAVARGAIRVVKRDSDNAKTEERDDA